MTQLETTALKPLPAESLADLLTGLAAGQWQAGELLDICQANIDKGDHPDRQFYTRRFDGQAKAEARAIDGLRGAGVPTGELAGLPIALKVLFDVAGEVTHAGSQWWDTPAKADALIVSRLRRAGALITGHTNMTEFAYSGLGINPHYGTPDNPVAPGRIPGGSSSPWPDTWPQRLSAPIPAVQFVFRQRSAAWSVLNRRKAAFHARAPFRCPIASTLSALWLEPSTAVHALMLFWQGNRRHL